MSDCVVNSNKLAPYNNGASTAADERGVARAPPVDSCARFMNTEGLTRRVGEYTPSVITLLFIQS